MVVPQLDREFIALRLDQQTFILIPDPSGA
jgi:hypothetical protein